MEKQQFLDKVKELADKVHKSTLERAEKLTKSGAVDFEEYDNNYRLPKNFMVANAEQTAWDYGPLKSKVDKAEIKNIFINL